jgi:hypothetical protein
MKAPTNDEMTCCEVVSSISNCAARGVAVPDAEANALTIVPSEKVATASMLVAMIFKMSSTASAPKISGTSSGTSGDTTAAISAVTTAAMP